MKSPLSPLVRFGHEHEWQIRLAYRRLRQRAFIVRVKVHAKLEQGSVHFDLAPDLLIGKNVRVVVWPGTHTVFKLGPKSRIGDGVLLHLKGGEFSGGIRTDLRAHTSVQVEGKLTLDGENTISYGCVLHCGDSVHLGYAAIMAEYSSVADSTHFHTDADDPIGENVKFAPVEIGRNTFICPRVSIGRGVTIGAWTVVGPSSVVSKDIPAGVFASGIPAEVVRAMDHPWMSDVENGVPDAPEVAWPTRPKWLP